MRTIHLEGETVWEQMRSLNSALASEEFELLLRQRMSKAVDQLKPMVRYATVTLTASTFNQLHRWSVSATLDGQMNQNTSGEVLSWAVDSMDMLLRREQGGRLILPAPKKEKDE